MNKLDIIEQLHLEPHPSEGGYFYRTYESQTYIGSADSLRKLASAIYYMLTDDSPCTYLHRNRSDIVHCFHGGSSIRYTLISDEGNISQSVLGNKEGEQFQLVVPGGVWKTSELVEGEYGLLTEVVVPGFEYKDNEIASLEKARELLGNKTDEYKRFIKLL